MQYFLVIPLACAFAIALFGRRPKDIGAVLAPAGGAILSILSISFMYRILKSKALIFNVGKWAMPSGITMSLDSLSVFMLVTVNVVATLILIYSGEYVKKFTDRWKFYTLFMLMLAGINGVLVTGDIFNLYVFLEIAAIAGYFLVAFGTGPQELEASFKYAVMGSVASIFILLGIALLYGHTSTFNMMDMSAAIARSGMTSTLKFVAALFLMGFGLKAALVPFHAWLPYAHSSAPAPVSAMLSGVSIKVLGIYALTRIFFNVFGMTAGLSLALVILAVLSMVVGSILAFGQTDIKRLFAYSSISQIGYIALGLGVGTPLAIFGAFFHLFNHSIFKSLLFLNAGSIEHIAGTRDMNKIRGIMEKSPVVGNTTLIGALSICGMPPFGGFWSKLVIIIACIQANRPALAFTAAFVSILTLGYYFKALGPVLFGKDNNGHVLTARAKIPLAMSLPVVILAVISTISVAMLLPGVSGALLKYAVAAVTGAHNYALVMSGAAR
jgi:multicomponent Na+:H+ antiporter subunit D